MVKTYLRFEQQKSFGVICSSSAPITYDSTGRLALTASLERVIAWNITQGTMAFALDGGPEAKAQVTALCTTGEEGRLAVGYEDGKIRVFELESQTLLLTLNGHKSAVTTLRYNQDSSLLISGSKDASVVVWDPVAESGLYRLKGHKDAVTDCCFLSSPNRSHSLLLTASKDGLVKVWDMESQHCIQTLTSHRAEVWSLDVSPDGTRLATGCGDGVLKWWSVNASNLTPDAQGNVTVCEAMGDIPRLSKKRPNSIRFNSAGTLLICQAPDKVMDIYRLRKPEEVKKKIKRRQQRVREKARKTGNEDKEKEEEKEEAKEEESTSDLPQASDEVEALPGFRSKDKITSFSFSPQKGVKKQDKIIVGFGNNWLGVYVIPPTPTEPAYELSSQLTIPGNPVGVRVVKFSSDDRLLLSSAGNAVKVWSAQSTNCIRTMLTGFGLTALWAPGDRHIIVGTRNGELEIWDVSSGEIIRKIEAHTGAIWALESRPDGKGIITGSGDKEVKCWDYELVQSESGAKELNLVHTRTLKLTDEVMCVKYSPNSKLIAVGLLDNTIKVFFEDSFKFFLSLYGHKLPVMSLDISSDSTLLVSGSADKNVKIWGLDFGDCHKSIFAHADSVTKVEWVPKTHYFFSVGKDKCLKYWDGDRFEMIASIECHHAEIWGLSVSSLGDMVATSSNDRSIRIFKQTDEQLFLDEEREKRMEAVFDEGAVIEQKRIGHVENSGLEEEPESTAVGGGKADKETLVAGELLMTALDLAKGEERRWQEYHHAVELRRKAKEVNKQTVGNTGLAELFRTEEPSTDVPLPPRNILLKGPNAEAHMLFTLKSIRYSHLDQALAMLPFEYAQRMMKYLSTFIKKDMELETSMRALLFLLSTHQSQIVSTQSMLEEIAQVKRGARTRIAAHKDQVGFNLAGLKLVKQLVDGNTNKYFFGDKTSEKEAEESTSSKTALSTVQDKDKNKDKKKKRPPKGKAALAYGKRRKGKA